VEAACVPSPILVGLIAALRLAMWYRPHALEPQRFLRVRRVEGVGARYAKADEIVSRFE